MKPELKKCNGIYEECGSCQDCGCGRFDCIIRIYRDDDVVHWNGKHWYMWCLLQNRQVEIERLTAENKRLQSELAAFHHCG